MIILKCKKKDCEGHLVGWKFDDTPVLLPNKTHKAEGKVEVTPEIRKQLKLNHSSEPFNTFMKVVQEESEK